ncbi:putative ABC transport system ATP-binding protein [Austwickia chelonae]|uniref:Putative ABC transporter ATP-binding protein n=1 Tax=Austwickia chelonae NBRC 105200 TaxID=1184607 RepID=K6UMN2_9MICO|nr:ABC transporter ATP-binding protein [Austwickia chelonae]GAB78261.1 putative ABC transporter ATP-binding protein [Austwickia chelonae NBRC 105200]SEV99892.1 putative ABC transport system ATP-binding protein [Austwickia chelonae]
MTTAFTRPRTRAAIRTEHLAKLYGSGQTGVTALDRIDVEIFAGEFTAVMGPSGSGKSTLMHVTAGLDEATSGRSWIGETEITCLSDDELTRLRRDRIGFVFQAFNLMPTLDARANMLLPLKLAGRRVEQDWFDQVVTVLGIGDRLGHRPSELSGGQQQRIAIARALLSRPAVIFADEPTGALDSASGDAILEFLSHSVRELGQTVVMVTHDDHAASYTDRIITLTDGRIVSDDIRAGAEV